MDFVSLLGDSIQQAIGPTAIVYALQGLDTPRPMTHDLFKTVLDDLDVTLARVEITDLQNGTFYAEIELDREKKRVSRNGQPVDLGPTEYRLLEFLMERPGRVFSREQLLDGVWGSDIYIDERTVDVHVGRLRKAINRGHAADPIRTVRGAGYALDDRFGRIN